MKTVAISSLQNLKIKKLLRLKEKRGRDKSKKFLIEGSRELSRALEGKQKIEEFYFCPELFSKESKKLFLQIQKEKPFLFRLTPSLFKKISYREKPDGFLALSSQFKLSLRDLTFHTKMPLIVIAESIEKPGNLGALLRSSDATGVDAVIVADPLTDIFHPNVIRASMGCLFTIPIVEAKKEEIFRWLKTNHIALLALTPHAKRTFIKTNLKIPLAIAVGKEATGLSQPWIERADLQVKIPMFGKADSLNVTVATTLLLYEALRQRKEI